MRARTRCTRALPLLACIALAFASPASAQPTVGDHPEARKAAEAWLGSLTAGDFRSSWDEAGEMFRAGTSAEAWLEQAVTGYQQIGDLVVRELAEVHAITDPPDAPPAEYVFIRFHSQFTLAGRARETVVLTYEPERGWRVIGYSVEPPAPQG
jgi:hypothetical protein